MDTYFQLWDTTTGNLVTEFDSEDEALAALRSVRAKDGDESLLEFALIRFQDDRPTLVAKERGLVLFVTRARRRSDNQSIGGGVSVTGRSTTANESRGDEVQGTPSGQVGT